MVKEWFITMCMMCMIKSQYVRWSKGAVWYSGDGTCVLSTGDWNMWASKCLIVLVYQHTCMSKLALVQVCYYRWCSKGVLVQVCWNTCTSRGLLAEVCWYRCTSTAAPVQGQVQYRRYRWVRLEAPWSRLPPPPPEGQLASWPPRPPAIL